MTVKQIRAALEKALLQKGPMNHELYRYELEELVEELTDSLKQDNDEFIFAVTANSEGVAMILITATDDVFSNEKAREKLQSLWPLAYKINLKQLIPVFTQQIFIGELPVIPITYEHTALMTSRR